MSKYNIHLAVFSIFYPHWAHAQQLWRLGENRKKYLQQFGSILQIYIFVRYVYIYIRVYIKINSTFGDDLIVY